MISLSSIRTHMFCPMKLYIQTHHDADENNDAQLHSEIKKLKIDVQDMIQKNMRKIKKEMSIIEIEDILSENIGNYLQNTFNAIETMNLNLTNEDILRINDETYFTIKLYALRIKQSMEILDKNAYSIVEMFFPNCIYSFRLKDRELNLTGNCDKIEIIDGKHFPVSVKTSKPPASGVWDQDAVDLAGQAILIEEEFDTEVFVGFVEYSAIGERRPVIMDVNLRKSFFDEFNAVKEIIYQKIVPKIDINPKKCVNCKYKKICLEE